MKFSQVIQSLLLGLILLGLFAIMAQNSYGLTLIGMSCFGLALLYIVQITVRVSEAFSGTEKGDIINIFELLFLALLISLFGFRVFYINIPFGNLIFITICCSLIMIYLILASAILNAMKNENPAIARNLLFFYLSIIIFLLSLFTRIINPSLSRLTGTLGIAASFPFLLSLLQNKKYDYKGKSISLFQFVISSKNKAGMLYLIFMFSAIYIGLSSLKIIPSIDNTDKPATYLELINQAETGKEKPVNGKYQHEIYKDAMDKFLARHGNNKH